MSQEWIDIQSFFADQQVLQAINDLSIAIKQEFAGISDIDRLKRHKKAKETIRRFFAKLNELFSDSIQNVTLGLDSRSRDLFDAFKAARRDSANYRSVLMRGGPESAMTLLDATDKRAKEELLLSLSELRKVVARHQQMDVSAIFEDF